MTAAHIPLIERYRDRLPFEPNDRIVSLQEGSTPLLRAPLLSEMVGASVRLKLEGANPTGSWSRNPGELGRRWWTWRHGRTGSGA